MKIDDITDPYEKIIQFNKELGLTPRKPRYSVIGEDYYGVYDDYSLLQKDIKGLKDPKVIKEKDNNGWKAAQKCYCSIYDGGTCKYILEPITKANTIVKLRPVGRLFEAV